MYRKVWCLLLPQEKGKENCSLQWKATAVRSFPSIPLLFFFFIRRVFLSSKREREREKDCKLSKRTVRKQEALKSTRESKMKSICRRFPRDMWAIVKQAVRTAISFLLLRRSLVPKGCYLVIALTLWTPAREAWVIKVSSGGLYQTGKRCP